MPTLKQALEDATSLWGLVRAGILTRPEADTYFRKCHGINLYPQKAKRPRRSTKNFHN